jgi:hypothetical protein
MEKPLTIYDPNNAKITALHLEVLPALNNTDVHICRPVLKVCHASQHLDKNLFQILADGLAVRANMSKAAD